MANFKNTEPYKVTTKTTAPAPANGTGTIVTDRTAVIGTGTAFQSELRRGSWLVSLAADEIRIVTKVESDTFARVREPFTADITSSTPSIIANTSMNIRTLSVGIKEGLTDGEVDGSVLTNGTSLVFTKEGDSKDNFKNFNDPLIIDGTGTIIDVVISR